MPFAYLEVEIQWKVVWLHVAADVDTVHLPTHINFCWT